VSDYYSQIIMKRKSVPQSKHWCFTLNNPSEDDESTVLEEHSTYLVIGKEVGEEGTPHLQGYVAMKSRKELTAMKKLIPRAHWEISRGTPQEASDYCKKDGSFQESGVLPVNGGVQKKRNWDAALASAKLGNFEEIPADMLIQHYHAFKRIKQDYPQPIEGLDEVCGEWFWGAPGVGKSRMVRERWPLYYDKPCNKWWDGYQGEETVLIDDFDLTHKVLGHHLKRWSDHYPFPAEMKGTTIQIRPKRIIVTSNYPPSAIFTEDDVLCAAILRRFKVHEVVILK